MDSHPPANSGLRAWLSVHALLIALICAAFAPWWGGGKVFAPLDILHEMLLPWRGDTTVPQVHNHFTSDAVTQYLPYRWFAQESFAQDGFVGWNPLKYGGVAEYENTMALHYDWTMQLHRWFDFWTAWHLGIIGQLIIAGCGMLVFLRSRGISPPIAMIGAIAYAGNSQFIVWIYHRWALGSFCWMPWVLWAVMNGLAVMHRQIKEQRFPNAPAWSWAALAGGFTALAFMGGSLQHCAYVVLAYAAIWAASGIRTIPHRPRFFVQSTLLLCGAGLLAVCLAGPMFLATIPAYLDTVAAGQDRGGMGYPDGIVQAPLNLLSFAFNPFPYLLGSAQSVDLWKAFKSDLSAVSYFGFIPGLLAILALWRRENSVEAKCLLGLGLLIPLTPLVGPLYHRVLLLYILGGVWLACDLLQRADKNTLRRWSHWLCWLFAGVSCMWALVSVGVMLFRNQILETIGPVIATRAAVGQFTFSKEWISLRTEGLVDGWMLWSSHSFIPWFLALCGVAIIYLLSRARSNPAVLHVLLAAVVFAECLNFGARWATFSDLKTFPYPGATPDIETLQAAVGNERIAIDLGIRSPFPPNTLQPFGIAITGGYDSIIPRIPPPVGELRENPHLAAMQGIGFLLTPKGEAATWIPTAKLGFGQIQSNPEFRSRYLFVSPTGSHEHVGSNSQALAVIEETFNRRVLQAPAGAEAILVLENYHPGWTYTVDGGPVLPVHRADEGFLFHLPEGTQGARIILSFHPVLRLPMRQSSDID